MTNVLIRDVPDEVLAAVDRRAKRMGISRSEYLRRAIAREQIPDGSVSIVDLESFSATFADLADDDVMGQAWS